MQIVPRNDGFGEKNPDFRKDFQGFFKGFSRILLAGGRRKKPENGTPGPGWYPLGACCGRDHGPFRRRLFFAIFAIPKRHSADVFTRSRGSKREMERDGDAKPRDSRHGRQRRESPEVPSRSRGRRRLCRRARARLSPGSSTHGGASGAAGRRGPTASSRASQSSSTPRRSLLEAIVRWRGTRGDEPRVAEALTQAPRDHTSAKQCDTWCSVSHIWEATERE